MADNKAKILLGKIKALFADTLPTSYQLADGTQVSISLLDIGGDFSMGGAPATAGTYTLMDGTNVAVDATGKITSVQAPEDLAATEYTLADGTKVSIDKMDVGGKVLQGTTPIANGDYTLEDGSKITTVDGAITVVTPKVAAVAKTAKEQLQEAFDVIGTTAVPDQMPKVVACVKALMDYCFGWQIDDPTYNPAEEVQDAQQVADAIAAYTTLKQQFTSQESEVKLLRTELAAQKKLSSDMLQLMTELAEAPAADPPAEVNNRKIIFSGEKPTSKKTALERYATAAQKLHDEQHVNN